MSYIFPEDVRKYKLHRLSLECKIFDLKYIALLKVVCIQDLGIQPSIFHKIYFLNINRKTIFYIMLKEAS